MNTEPSRNRKALSRIFLAAAIGLMDLAGVARASSVCPQPTAAVFSQGQRALQNNDLQRAEEIFRQVAQCDPRSAAAYVNLGVVMMRRKQWNQALDYLNRAEALSPSMPGVHLDKGLVYFRQGNYKSAIPELRIVARQSPSTQPQYLLGLSYFFVGEYRSAAETFERNWGAQSDNLVYLMCWESPQSSQETNEPAVAHLHTFCRSAATRLNSIYSKAKPTLIAASRTMPFPN